MSNNSEAKNYPNLLPFTQNELSDLFKNCEMLNLLTMVGKELKALFLKSKNLIQDDIMESYDHLQEKIFQMLFDSFSSYENEFEFRFRRNQIKQALLKLKRQTREEFLQNLLSEKAKMISLNNLNQFDFSINSSQLNNNISNFYDYQNNLMVNMFKIMEKQNQIMGEIKDNPIKLNSQKNENILHKKRKYNKPNDVFESKYRTVFGLRIIGKEAYEKFLSTEPKDRTSIYDEYYHVVKQEEVEFDQGEGKDKIKKICDVYYLYLRFKKGKKELEPRFDGLEGYKDGVMEKDLKTLKAEILKDGKIIEQYLNKSFEQKIKERNKRRAAKVQLEQKKRYEQKKAMKIENDKKKEIVIPLKEEEEKSSNNAFDNILSNVFINNNSFLSIGNSSRVSNKDLANQSKYADLKKYKLKDEVNNEDGNVDIKNEEGNNYKNEHSFYLLKGDRNGEGNL